jgi:hypothetical protein
MMTLFNNSTELQRLRAIFQSAGYELWFVGGCVRDSLMGKEPKDIDLCTSATPDEQVAVYQANGVRFIPTGLQHGTVTVVLDEPYEITSLRTESDHDGRWATMAYTRDLNEDLSRRDLTINAMALDFDGNLIDPFGGEADLKDRRVRFVGNAAERMREDYLRILRFFRFHARIAGDAPLDGDAKQAICDVRGGLAQISVERVWMEMSKIISGPSASAVLRSMRELMLFEIIGMPPGMTGAIRRCQYRGVRDPASIMGHYVREPSVIESLADQWKWSKVERDRALFVAREGGNSSMARWKELRVDGAPMEWVADLMRFQEADPAELETWAVPKFPVTGGDLLIFGFKPGPALGETIKRLTKLWKESDYKLTNKELVFVAVYEGREAGVIANDV